MECHEALMQRRRRKALTKNKRSEQKNHRSIKTLQKEFNEDQRRVDAEMQIIRIFLSPPTTPRNIDKELPALPSPVTPKQRDMITFF